MRDKLILIIIFLFVSCTDKVENRKAEQVIEKNNISISITPSTHFLRSCDLLELTIELTYPQDMTVKLPGSDDNYGDFTVFQVNQGSPVAVNQELNRITHILILEPGLPGDHNLPELTFKFWDADSRESSYSSKEMNFKVSSVLSSEQTEMEDIITVEKKSELWLIVVGFLLIISPVCWLSTRKRSKLLTEDEKLDKVYEEFAKLRELQPEEILKSIPAATCSFLKAKFSLHDLPDNMDVVLRELEELISAEEMKKLAGVMKHYDEIRYSENLNKDNIPVLWKSLDDVLNGLRRTAA